MTNLLAKEHTQTSTFLVILHVSMHNIMTLRSLFSDIDLKNKTNVVYLNIKIINHI